MVKLFTHSETFSVADGGSLASMTPAEYDAYIRETLISMDHHEAVRFTPGGPIMAVTKEQCKQLISYLTELSAGMSSVSEERRQAIEKQLRR